MAPNYDYDEDDFVDQYDSEGLEAGGDDDELSPEDKIAMEKGTIAVRQALGTEAHKVNLKQIQDALWHYYYDVDKSVVYLTKTFIAQAPKSTPKKTTEGKNGVLRFSDSRGLYCGATGADQNSSEHHRRSNALTPTSSFPVLDKPQILPAMFFADMPWLNVPQDRITTFVEPPRLPGGLLGGSEGPPKMTKLQALAAARKKKAEEKKEQEKLSQTEKAVMETPPLEEKRIETSKLLSLRPKRQEAEVGTVSHSTAPAFPSDSSQKVESIRDAPDMSMHVDGPSKFPLSNDPLPVAEREALVAHQQNAPSAFAQTLFRSAPEANEVHRQDFFAMPYTSSPSFHAIAFSEPSPDDIVLAAQAKAGKKPTAPTTPKTAKKAQKSETPKDSGMSSSIASLKLTDTPPPKSRGLDVVKEFEQSTRKKSASFVVVGHVDAGKSTLMGRLLLELKIVEERTVDKYRRQAEKSGKQSFALAWVMDQRSEERDRGVTIDIATNYFETEKTKFTILDAPGHRDFVPNMIAGASQADFAILVIDANTGAYEKGLKGQTREHVLLLRSLGVQRLIVAVNKLDMVGWSQERFQEINEEVSGFLNGLGFQDKFVTFVPISGLNGDNIVRRTKDEAAGWYSSGPTLIEVLEAFGTSTVRALKKPFRMAISEVFRSQQGTATLAGRIDSGTVQIGDVVIVQPSGETAYVKSIALDTEAQDWAVAGQNVSVALSDIDPIHIRVGDIVCHTTDPINVGDTFTMKAMAFDHLMPMPVDLHRGRLHAAGQIQFIAATLDKSTGQIIKKKPKIIQPGDVARILIKLEAKVPLEAGQRVVIRSGGETIAAGLLE